MTQKNRKFDKFEKLEAFLCELDLKVFSVLLEMPDIRSLDKLILTSHILAEHIGGKDGKLVKSLLTDYGTHGVTQEDMEKLQKESDLDFTLQYHMMAEIAPIVRFGNEKLRPRDYKYFNQATHARRAAGKMTLEETLRMTRRLQEDCDFKFSEKALSDLLET